MTNIEKIEDMLNKQDGLNCLTSGDDWKSGITNKGKTIDWLRCIRREAMELCDSFPWEHWKALDKEPDIDNALIETTDIWFFIMSYILSKNTLDDTLVNNVIKSLEVKLLTSEKDIPLLADNLIHATYIKHIHASYGIEYSYLLYNFIKIMKALDIDLDLLHRLYNGKLMLNKFRQDNGYKEGKYRKIWDNKEDNVHMLDIIRINKNITNDVLYEALSNRYNSLVIKG